MCSNFFVKETEHLNNNNHEFLNNALFIVSDKNYNNRQVIT